MSSFRHRFGHPHAAAHATVEVRVEGRRSQIFDLKIAVDGIVSYPAPMAVFGGIYWPLHGFGSESILPYIKIPATAAERMGL